MRVSLATSLHLNHGATGLNRQRGAPPIMQAFVPVGLLALKAVADRDLTGVNTRVTEVNTLINRAVIPNDDRFYDRLADAVVEPGDDLIGLMTDADSLHHTIALAQRVHQRTPLARIALGGPAASPIGPLLLSSFRFIDFVVSGEGEQTFVELLDALQHGRAPADVRGLTWRKDGSICRNLGRHPIPDLDSLPVPAFDTFDMSQGALYLDIGRGCPFNCQFCATAPFWERKYRMKSIGRILAELRLLRDRYGRRHVNFSHDIFTFDRPWVRDFCRRLTEEELEITWTCSTRTDVMELDLLPRMAEAGCVEIYYGIESGSPEIQKAISKNLDLDWARRIVEATARTGIRAITGFIVGYPMESRKTLTDTLTRYFEFLDAGNGRSYLFTLCPFHESPMFRQYGPTAARPAEYLDLPLCDGAAAAVEAVQLAVPEAFVSTRRYETPGVPAGWVDASEELSAHLVVLKRLWPKVLPLYDSPLEFYARWVEWIAAENAGRRPWSRLRHQGDTADLLRFVAAELDARSIGPGPLRDLLRYEQLKWEAGKFPTVSPAVPAVGRTAITEGMRVVRARPMLFAAFDSDLKHLLNGPAEPAPEAVGPRWVVFARAEGEGVDTLQVGDLSIRVLTAAERPQALSELLAEFPPEIPHHNLLDLVTGLMHHNLLTEVSD